ncbi:MAG TPA: tripartite tricarboxylate transporter substrate binding protein [Burkholderiales bacterium]|nr:tripartite tricarboxylate transporter substrate binding protein [Burkholderiales bacterium]
MFRFVRVIVLLVAAPAALAQENYPERPIRIVVPTAPGGPSDIGARLIAQELTKRWGRQVVVDTRPGAGSIIGTEIVARAAPDGYTLLLTPSTLAINPATYKSMPYDGLRDFAPITQTHFVPNLILLHPSVPVHSVKELVALAKARPGEILYGSSGHGTNPHLVIELFASMTQIRLTHVPYKGTLPGLIETLAGRVAMIATSSMSLTVPQVRAGKLRALGITSATRSAALPDIPTIAESGVPGYEAVQWSGLLAPAGTPPPLIARLNREVAAILRGSDIRDRLAADSAEVVAGSPEQFAEFLKLETAKWARVVKAAGITPE